MQQTANPPAAPRRISQLRAVADLPADPPRTTAARFSEAVRTVVTISRRRGLRPPVFRSPPRLDGVDRTIRRRPDGSCVVSVRREGRPLAAVQADVVEGVVAANGLHGQAADTFRHAAWAALEGGGMAGQRASMGRSAAPSARVA